MKHKATQPLAADAPTAPGIPRRRTRGNGAGSVHKRTDGHYRWQITLGRDAQGKQIRRSGAAITKGEANRRLTEVLAAHQKGLVSLPDVTTVGDWLDLWLARRQPHIAPGTHEQYCFRLKHIPPRMCRLRLQDLKRSHVRELADQLTEKGLSVSTRGKILSHLRTALEAAIEDEILVINPAQGIRVAATVAERSQNKRKALSLGELQAFLTAAQGDPLYALFYTLFSLGLRRGEALGLRWQDLNLNTGEIQIEQQVKLEANRAVIGSLKTTSSRRRLYASQDLVDVLRAQQVRQQVMRELVAGAWTESGLVFTTSIGTPVHPRNVNRDIYLICNRAGIPLFGSHTARHTHITQRLRAGQKLEIVSAIAGHANPSITIDIYRHIAEDEKRTATFSLKEQLSHLQDE